MCFYRNKRLLMRKFTTINTYHHKNVDFLYIDKRKARRLVVSRTTPNIHTIIMLGFVLYARLQATRYILIF